MAQLLSLTRCDVCGAGVERTEVCNSALMHAQRWSFEAQDCPCCLALPLTGNTPLTVVLAGLHPDDLRLRPHVRLGQEFGPDLSSLSLGAVS